MTVRMFKECMGLVFNPVCIAVPSHFRAKVETTLHSVPSVLVGPEVFDESNNPL